MGRQRAQVTIATICDDGGPGFHFWDSWDGLVNYDRMHGQHINGRIKIMSGPRLVEGRSNAVTEYLSNPATREDTHLLCLDADMGYPPNLVERMLDVMYAGAPDDKPIHCLGGLCFAGNEDRIYPTLYEQDPRSPHYAPRPMCRLEGELEFDEEGNILAAPKFSGSPYPRDRLIKVAATGGACVMVSREVLIRMTAPYPDGYGSHPSTGAFNPYPWFAEGVNAEDGHSFGEDIVFCQRIRALGVGVYVHTGIALTHWKVGALLSQRTWDERLHVAYPSTWQDKVRAAPDPERQLVLA